ncbi:hypothetical protein BCV71DRAFT_238682 [Rhizopus microsporus]|uniref:Uncharacterized protein n=1 Tax=Rhizopus microsporus TaxID=58291 RepID=A0A1X0RQ34_RHIZD|nr:hypothetical protein BCV71DRAFT_238682 [Rhizopus microsporus]
MLLHSKIIVSNICNYVVTYVVHFCMPGLNMLLDARIKHSIPFRDRISVHLLGVLMCIFFCALSAVFLSTSPFHLQPCGKYSCKQARQAQFHGAPMIGSHILISISCSEDTGTKFDPFFSVYVPFDVSNPVDQIMADSNCVKGCCYGSLCSCTAFAVMI